MTDSFGDIWEGSSARVYGIVKDQDDVVFQPTTLNFTLYDYRSKDVINSHDNDSLTVGTYIDASGVLTYPLLAADNVFIDGDLREELHIARFTWTWSSGTRTTIVEIPFTVTALANI